MKKLVVANWKMGITSLNEAKIILSEVKRVAHRLHKIEAVICPPTPFISALTGGKIKLGAQDCSAQKEGAHTGEVSAPMLKSVGATHVILGHSERRALGETDELISQKLKLALSAGLKPVLCVGEHARDREGHYLEFVKAQLEAVLRGAPKSQLHNIVLTYEPVWAISTYHQTPPTPHDCQQMVIFMKKVLAHFMGSREALAQPVLYGGSADNRNAQDFLMEGGVSGLLVGRASLTSKKFNEILKIAEKI